MKYDYFGALSWRVRPFHCALPQTAGRRTCPPNDMGACRAFWARPEQGCAKSRFAGGNLERSRPKTRQKKIRAGVLEIDSGFSNLILPLRAAPGAILGLADYQGGGRCLRPFVSTLLSGGFGYEDLRFCSPLAFDHRLRPPV
jgi:hypothetical protein